VGNPYHVHLLKKDYSYRVYSKVPERAY